jgi:hypothetical protein
MTSLASLARLSIVAPTYFGMIRRMSILVRVVLKSISQLATLGIAPIIVAGLVE